MFKNVYDRLVYTTQAATGAVSQATQTVTGVVSNNISSAANLTSSVLTNTTPSLLSLSQSMLNVPSSFFSVNPLQVMSERQKKAQELGLKKTLATMRTQPNTWVESALSAITAFMSNEKYYEDCLEHHFRIYQATERLFQSKKEILELDRELNQKIEKKNFKPIHHYQLPKRLSEEELWDNALQEIVRRSKRLSEISEEISLLENHMDQLKDEIEKIEKDLLTISDEEVLTQGEKFQEKLPKLKLHKKLYQELNILKGSQKQLCVLLRQYSGHEAQVKENQRKDILLFREYCHYASKTFMRTSLGTVCGEIEKAFQKLKTKIDYDAEKTKITDELFNIYSSLNDFSGKREKLLSAWKMLINLKDEKFSTIDYSDKDMELVQKDEKISKKNQVKKNLELVVEAEKKFWNDEELLDVSHLELDYSDTESQSQNLEQYLTTFDFQPDILNRLEKLVEATLAKYSDVQSDEHQELKRIVENIRTAKDLLAKEKEILSCFLPNNKNEVRYVRS